MQKWVTAAVLGLLAVVLLPAAPASAHAKLTGSNPQAGQMVTADLPVVTLSFSGPVKAELSTIVIAGPDGVNMTNGPATVADVTLTQPVKALPPGQIKVTWRTVSADGHPIEGTFDFTNANPAASRPSPSASETSAAAAPATTRPADVATSSSASSSDEGVSPFVWLLVAALVLAAASGGAVWYRRRSAD
ncbi:copper resistance CopC family protein [Virgisporangium aurantiacum]|nr:copper resistance CopC family protein [Virgisporangium aurantiacum]